MKLPIIVEKLKAEIDRTELGKRLFSGISWTLVGSIAGKLLQLISFIVVARILQKEDYGQLGIIRSTIAMFLMFSTLGMGMTALRYIALYRNTDPFSAYRIYKFSFSITTIFAVLISFSVLIFSKPIAELSFSSDTLNKPLLISVVAIFFMSLSSVQLGALNGLEHFKSIGINSTINGVIQLILVISLAYFYNIPGAIWAIGISSAVLFLQFNYSLKSKLRELRNSDKSSSTNISLKRIFINFSLPAVLSGIVTMPVLWWAKTYLIKNSGFAEMATYDVAEQWYYVILFIPASLSSIILPLLTNTTAEGTSRQYNKLIKLNLIVNVSITIVLAGITALFSPLINGLYGSDFNNIFPMLILLVSAVICAANNVLGQIIASKGRMWIGFIINIVWGFWLVLFSFVFIGKLELGASGLAYAVLTSYTLHSIMQTFVARKIKFN